MKFIRSISVVLLMVLSLTVYAQKYQTKSSTTSFFSTTPVEDIKANTTETKGVLDADAKTFFFKVPIKSFVFKSDLMRDHFNENYMESEKFPTSTFKGKIEGDFDLKADGTYPVNAVGELTIHGVTNNVTLPSTITVKGGIPSIESKFKVKLVDYKIEVPKIVFSKIAEEIEVKITSTLEKMAK